MQHVAIIGSGISGLGAAWLLRQKYAVTLYEQDHRAGGHSNTVMVTPPNAPAPIAVDTGFIVCNERTYPNLLALFRHLGVALEVSDMSFGMSSNNGALEYSSDSLWTMFGQKRNLFRPHHWQMLADLLRFFKAAPKQVADLTDMTLAEYLRRGHYGHTFIHDHLLPMAAAIWSSDPQKILDFPAASFIRFYINHGLLEADVKKRSRWFTVSGGSQNYVKKIIADSCAQVKLGCSVSSIKKQENRWAVKTKSGDTALYDQVVVATHADQALRLLETPSAQQSTILGAFSYLHNRAVLHRDTNLMPARRHLWASWNYLTQRSTNTASVTYWMNRLQNIDRQYPLFVSLKASRPIAADKVYAAFDYTHPQFDLAAMQAQRQLKTMQGRDGLWFCGSYCGYGFHEDGLASGLAVAEATGCKRPWQITDVSPAFANATPAVAL
jgi:uncharacterized protein